LRGSVPDCKTTIVGSTPTGASASVREKVPATKSGEAGIFQDLVAGTFFHSRANDWMGRAGMLEVEE
jgi:hypothetical protein